jgi:hypothetical protein
LGIKAEAVPVNEDTCIADKTFERRQDLAGLELVSEWLNDCTSNHPLCRLESPPPLPLRVIDVQSRDEPFLYDTNGERGNYLALTYCWGRNRNMDMMTFGPNSKGRAGMLNPKNNIDLHRKGIPFAYMSKTIQDAVTVCRTLGYRYLWIDALCIIQGDEEEWKRESPKMADVYANAKLTIAADSAEAVEKGFLSFETQKTDSADDAVERYLSDFKERVFPEEHAQVSNGKCPSTLLWNEPLNIRAWSLGEAIFSNRILHYTSFEMVWECNEVRKCECGHSQIFQDDDVDSFRIFRNMELAKGSAKADLYRKWDTVIQHFTRRMINNHSGRQDRDPLRLVALSRVARRFSDILKKVFCSNDDYLAGVWKGDLVKSLLWSVERCLEENHHEIAGKWRKPEQYRAPSWSWAALEGPVLVEPVKDFHQTLEIKEASVQHYDESDQFSQILSSKLEAYGPIIHNLELRLQNNVETDLYAGHRCLVSRPGFQESLAFTSDLPLTPEELDQEFSCLYIGKGNKEISAVGLPRTYYGVLLLRAVAGATKTYERIGISSSSTNEEEAVKGFLESTSNEWISLV